MNFWNKDHIFRVFKHFAKLPSISYLAILMAEYGTVISKEVYGRSFFQLS